MEIIENLDQVQKATELLFKIRNSKTAEFTARVDAYSCVTSMDIDLHIPKWESGHSPEISFHIYFIGKRNANEIILAKLENYANNGFENDPLFIERKEAALAAKKALFNKLKKELKSI